MNVSEFTFVTSRPYSSLLREISILGSSFHQSKWPLTCRRKPSPIGVGLLRQLACLAFIGYGALGHSAASRTASWDEPTAATVRSHRRVTFRGISKGR